MILIYKQNVIKWRPAFRGTGIYRRIFFPTTFLSLSHAHMIILRDRMNIHAALFLWLALDRSLCYPMYTAYHCTLYRVRVHVLCMNKPGAKITIRRYTFLTN